MKTLCIAAALLFINLFHIFGQTTSITLDNPLQGIPFIVDEGESIKISYWSSLVGDLVIDNKIKSKGKIFQGLEQIKLNSDGSYQKKFIPELVTEVKGNYQGLYTAGPHQGPVQFASYTDLVKEDLIKEHRIFNYRPYFTRIQNTKTYSSISFRGKGLRAKPPFSFSCESSTFLNEFNLGDEVKNFKEIDIPTENPNEYWTMDVNAIPEGTNFPTILGGFQKYTTKDKSKLWNYLSEYKFVTFDKDGNIVKSFDKTFERAVIYPTRNYIYDEDGIKIGTYLAYREAFGLGFKRANPNPNKRAVYIIGFDLEGNNLIDATIEVQYDMGALSEFYGWGVFKNGGKYTLVHIPSSKKGQPDEISFYNLGVDSQPTTILLDEIKAKVNDSSGFSASMNEDLSSIKLNSGDLIFFSLNTEVIGRDPKIYHYPSFNYFRVNKDNKVDYISSFSFPGYFENVGKKVIVPTQLTNGNVLLEVLEDTPDGSPKNMLFILDKNDLSIKSYNSHDYKENFLTQYYRKDGKVITLSSHSNKDKEQVLLVDISTDILETK